MAMLEVKDLQVYYGVIQALKGISFHVNQGEVIALIGANGAGKTTTLQTLTGILSPKSGSIVFEGKDLTRTPAHKIVEMGMAHVPEGRRVFADMSVYENLLLGAYTRKDKAEIAESLASVYKRFPRLEERKGQRAGTLSGGEQQMLAMGRALMSRPRIILMDEPSMGLIGMNNVVITIARQYGSGGRTIGEELAKKLGISYYDKDIIRMASEESGIHEQLFGRADENVSTKQRFFAKSGIYKGELIPPQSKDFTSDENLFNYQAKVIRQLAETESCVIIGRCANMILKDYSNVLRVFVYGDWDFRIREASKKLSGTTKDIEKFMHKDDKRKEDFCKRFMGVDWADMTKYNLCLDNGTLGYEKCVEEIESALEILKK